MINANFTITPLTGDVFATTFSATNTTTGDPAKKIVWDFGTSEYLYNVNNPTYVYKGPGTYTVQLTAIDYSNTVSTASAEVLVDFAYRDYVTFTQIPETFPDPGKQTTEPFKIKVVSTNINGPILVDLFAANSKSTPSQFVPDKWNFLTPTWKFLDENLNTVTTLSVASSPVYKNKTIVALSGEASFYFIDSTSTGNPTINCPILITATLQTSSFVNSNDSYIYQYPSYANTNSIQTGALWLVNDLYPNVLRVTGNYIDRINETQWSGIKIPVLITCHSNKALTLPGALNEESEILFSYPNNNAAGKLYPLELTLNNIAPQFYTVDEQPLFFQSTTENNARVGGYIFTTITSQNTANNVTVSAKTTAFNNVGIFENDKFAYPYGYVPSNSVWISNPVKNTLNKITVIPYPQTGCESINILKENKTLLDGRIKEVTVPFSRSQSVINYELSGFSGIYAIAIDPQRNDIIACDADLDRIYRFSDTGKILITLELSTIGDFNHHKKMFENWSWSAITPMASSSRFAVYGPAILHPNPANFITTVGGVIQTTDALEVNIYARTLRLVRPYFTDVQLFLQGTPISVLNTLPGTYPPENTTVEAFQIFSPTLPEEYISTLYYWATSFPTNSTQTLKLTANPLIPDIWQNDSYKNLSSNTCKYIVSVGGLLQRPTSYTIDSINNTITFSQSVPPDTRINILYAPMLPATQSWSRTYNAPTNSFSFTNLDNYIDDPLSSFIVSVGGLLQSLKSYTFDYNNKQLVFSQNIPAGSTVTVIQYSLPDNAYNPAAYTPTYISLDKNYNIWVSLFNSVSVLKFDKDFNFLCSAIPENIEWLKRAWTVLPKNIGYQSAQFEDISRMVEPTNVNTLPQDSYTNEFFLKPPVVETDKDNNCWVTYANPLCSLLVKYSPTGQVLSQIPLDLYTMPISLAVTPNNNIWVANFHGSSYTYTALSGSLQLYDTNTSTLLSTVTGISRPGHLAIDRSGNLWFSHSTRRLGYLDVRTAKLSTWTLDLTSGFIPYNVSTNILTTEAYDSDENVEDDEIGGLAVDIYDRVWVIDHLQNYVYVLSATPKFLDTEVRRFRIRPNTFVGYYPDINTGIPIIQDEPGYYYRSAQATGDWTGNKWFQKYITPQSLSSIPLSGISNSFNIVPFINKYQIRLQNESFDMAEYFHSLALPEILYNNNKLFNELLPGSVGNSQLSSSEDMGQKIYERIANYVQNHGDIDTCNIDQLLSYAEQIAVPAADYGTSMPSEIKRMLDISSIPRQKLWGVKNMVPNILKSIGDRYNTQTDYITAGTKIILRNKFDSTLSLIQVPQLQNQNIYPLKDIQLYGFVDPVTINYLFYRFEPKYDSEYVENIIDWSSEYTTLDPKLSTNEEWYGDNKAVENAFRYLLTKNLFLK
jgi:hypothetical protein